jgi:hypothetical protein
MAREKQARIVSKCYCRLVPGDIIELLHDHAAQFAFRVSWLRCAPVGAVHCCGANGAADAHLSVLPRFSVDGDESGGRTDVEAEPSAVRRLRRWP